MERDREPLDANPNQRNAAYAPHPIDPAVTPVQPQTKGKYIVSLSPLHFYLHSWNAIRCPPPHPFSVQFPRPTNRTEQAGSLGKTPHDGAGPKTQLRRTAASKSIVLLKISPETENGTQASP